MCTRNIVPHTFLLCNKAIDVSLLQGMFIGETIALGVAVAWTATALFAEVGSKRMGSLPLNTVRMTMLLTLLFVTLWLTIGVPYPRFADSSTWLWLLLSGVVGYVIGDYCLIGYILIGSRFGQLFMTLSAPRRPSPDACCWASTCGRWPSSAWW